MDKDQMIQAYLDGEMPVNEKQKFEEYLLQDKELRNELDLFRDADTAIKEEEIYQLREYLKHNADGLVKNSSTGLIHFMRSMRIPLAASILLFIGLSLWKLIDSADPKQLYSSFYQPYNVDISTRSADLSLNNTQLALVLYQEGNYEASYEILKNYLSKNYDDQNAQFYFALNALELSHTDQAIDILMNIEADKNTPFAIHARWYVAMALLEDNKPKIASQYLEELASTNNMYSSRAKKILRKI